MGPPRRISSGRKRPDGVLIGTLSPILISRRVVSLAILAASVLSAVKSNWNITFCCKSPAVVARASAVTGCIPSAGVDVAGALCDCPFFLLFVVVMLGAGIVVLSYQDIWLVEDRPKHGDRES